MITVSVTLAFGPCCAPADPPGPPHRPAQQRGKKGDCQCRGGNHAGASGAAAEKGTCEAQRGGATPPRSHRQLERGRAGPDSLLGSKQVRVSTFNVPAFLEDTKEGRSNLLLAEFQAPRAATGAGGDGVLGCLGPGVGDGARCPRTLGSHREGGPGCRQPQGNPRRPCRNWQSWPLLTKSPEA